MTEQEVNNLIDNKIAKTKMSQLPEATQTSGLYSIGYNGNQSVKYKANLLQGDPLTVRKTYQTEAEALADKNPIDTTTSLPLKVGQFVSIVDDGEKNGIYRISSIGVDGTMSLELQGKLGDLSEYAKKGGSTKTLKQVDDEKADHGYANIEVAKTLKQVEDNASVKIKNEAVNGNFENGLISPFTRTDGYGGASTLAINSSTPISGNYDVRLTITTPATTIGRPYLLGLHRAGNIGDKIYLHFYAKILSGIPIISGINNGEGLSAIYGGDVINGRNTRIIDVVGTGNVGTIYFDSKSVWDMQMDNFMRINLTETFGAGNEPTEEEMNLLLDMLPVDYFEGEYVVPQEIIFKRQSALIIKNTNEKASHGYDSSPKTLKEVDGDLAQLEVDLSESLKYKTNRAKLLEDVRYVGLIDAFYGTEGSKGVECKGTQLTKSNGIVSVEFGDEGHASYTSTIKEGVELIKMQRYNNYFFVLVDWDLVTHIYDLGGSEDSFILDTPVTTDLKDWHKMLMSADYSVKEVTAFQYEMPQVYSCTWADGVEGIVTLSNFDGNVLEFRDKKATYKDLTITYGTITYDDLGYIKTQGITTINK